MNIISATDGWITAYDYIDANMIEVANNALMANNTLAVNKVANTYLR